MEAQFKIGDKVFMAKYDRVERWIQCPDCLGSAKVKVVLGDGTEIMLECGGCDPGGYEKSNGRIKQYDYEVQILPRIITGVKTRATEIEYELNNFGGGYYNGTPENVFANREDALTFGEQEKIKYESEVNARLLAKTKQHHTWKWNMAYHRRCIKEIERQLEYHNSKVQICKSHVKGGDDEPDKGA